MTAKLKNQGHLMPGKTSIVLNILVVGLFSAMQLHAQDVFVKDSLRVGVRTQPGNDVAPVAVVITGMKLTVLESSGNYLKIKSKSGVTGWVKATYVSSEPPARVYLQQLQEKYKEQSNSLEQQTKRVQLSELNAQALSEEISTLKTNTAELQIQLEDERSENQVTGISYLWKLGLLILVCIAGFAAGVFWHRRYAMKRLGGLSI